MFYIKNVTLFSILALALFITGCRKSPVGGDTDCPPLRSDLAFSPYFMPVWHPGGKIIAFNHTPLKKIYFKPDECLHLYEFYGDSSGFWMINVDSTRKQRILPYGLDVPDWSSDGEWIAFDRRAQIYKMRFSDGEFDTTTLTQLTFEGQNFFPSWSPDGQWIAYDNINCGSPTEPAPSNSCGVLMIESSGSKIKFVANGRMPDWSPDGKYLIYIGPDLDIYRVNVNDTTEIIRLTSLNQDQVDPPAADNRNPRYSPDGNKIAFLSQRKNGEDVSLVQIWIMNADGTGLTQLTTEGVISKFDWSPDGKEIVYVSFRYTDYTYDNGTLWIVNVETGDKRQLTFNNSYVSNNNDL